jgi:hypothetical protein
VTARSARIRAALLLYAALQFVVLTTIAMAVYADGYRFFFNFLSELGATHAWSGRANYPAMLLFTVALVTLGLAFIAFAGTWRAFAFARGRSKPLGVAAHVFGTASGMTFVAVGVTPVDVALNAHNTLVVVAFGLLLGYALMLTVVWSRNGATPLQQTASTTYLVLVLAYFGVVAMAARAGVATPRGRELLVASQKAFAYISMLYVVYITLSTRRQLAGQQ